MTIPEVLGLLLLGALVALLVWLNAQSTRKLSTQRARWVAEQRQRNEAKALAIEADLQEWLRTLELPALADQKRLEAAARQLRIVLFERLMNGPKVR